MGRTLSKRVLHAAKQYKGLPKASRTNIAGYLKMTRRTKGRQTAIREHRNG